MTKKSICVSLFFKRSSQDRVHFLFWENFFKGELYLKFLRVVNNKQSVPASAQMHLSVLDFQLQTYSTDL